MTAMIELWDLHAKAMELCSNEGLNLILMESTDRRHIRLNIGNGLHHFECSNMPSVFRLMMRDKVIPWLTERREQMHGFLYGSDNVLSNINRHISLPAMDLPILKTPEIPKFTLQSMQDPREKDVYTLKDR